jgi:hypothetical protein
MKIPLQHPGFCGELREKSSDYFPIVAIRTQCEVVLLLNNLNLSVMIAATAIQKGIPHGNNTIYSGRADFLVCSEQMDTAQAWRPYLNVGFLWNWKFNER